MTREEFQFQIEVRKEMEFKYQNVTYNLMYEKESTGKEYIKFGPLYEEQRYESFGELINHAKVGNCYLKSYIEDL